MRGRQGNCTEEGEENPPVRVDRQELPLRALWDLLSTSYPSAEETLVKGV